jgi:hypothetical protein
LLLNTCGDGSSGAAASARQAHLQEHLNKATPITGIITYFGRVFVNDVSYKTNAAGGKLVKIEGKKLIKSLLSL